MAWQIWEIKLKASDEIQLKLDVNQNGTIHKAELRGVGGPEMLSLLQSWRPHLQGRLQDVALPSGVSGPEIMLRHLLKKAQGSWQDPYAEEELCHCRMVPTTTVYQAIIGGAHTPEVVSRWTSASTACGNCRKDVVAIISSLLPKAGA